MHAQLDGIPQQTVKLFLRLLGACREWFQERALYRGAQRPESLRRYLAVLVAKNVSWEQILDVAINGVRRRNAVEPQVRSDRIAVNFSPECRMDPQTLQFGSEQEGAASQYVI